MGFWALHHTVDGIQYAPAQQQVQDLVVNGAEGIPAKFIKPLNSVDQDEAAQLEQPAEQSIPVIDVSSILSGDDKSLNFNAQAQEIVQASREWGLFQVVNHGVPSELIQRMSDLALQYFQRPAEDREMDFTTLPQPNSGSRDWIDTMVHFVQPPLPDVIKRRTLPQGYRETMQEYATGVSKIAHTLRRVLSLGLGLNSSRIEEAIGSAGTVMRVNYYPPCPRSDLVTGITAHTDSSVMTVLHQNEVEGLQVRKDGRWYTVPSIPNALIINISDILQVLSNDAYVSCEHRGFVNPHSPRFSMAVFVSMPGERHFSPLPELLDAEHPPLYKEITLGEYLDVVKAEGFRGKMNLETLRIPAAPATPPAAENETFIGKNFEPSTASGNVFTPKFIAVGA